MGTHIRSRETAASPERVWQLWSDTTTWPAWNPDVQTVELNRALSTGATGRMTTRAGGAHPIEIESVEPGRAFVLVASAAPGSRFAFRCEVVPNGRGGSRISQAVSMRGLLGPVYSAMMGERMADGFTPILDGLAQRAEAGPAT